MSNIEGYPSIGASGVNRKKHNPSRKNRSRSKVLLHMDENGVYRDLTRFSTATGSKRRVLVAYSKAMKQRRFLIHKDSVSGAVNRAFALLKEETTS